MLRKNRTTSTFLIIGISIIFSIAPAFSNYNRLLEADFLTLGVKFEAGDIDDLLVDRQMTLDFIPSQFLVIGSLGEGLDGPLIVSSLPLISIGLAFSPLRC